MRLKRNLQASLHPKRKSKTKCHQLMTGMKRLPRKKKTAKIETEEVEVEEVAETAVVVEANSEAEEDLKEDAAVKMVTAEMVKMVTVEMVKMDIVEAVAEAEAATGMETSETVNFVLAIAVENENLMGNEDLVEVNEVIVAEATVEVTRTAMSKRMETKS